MKNKYLILCFIPIIIMAAIVLFFLLNGRTASVENSVVMVKNSKLYIYCSGFVTGKNERVIVTSYSAAASSNGKTDGRVEVIFYGAEDAYDGNIIYSDEAKDIAVIKVNNMPDYIKPITIDSEIINDGMDTTIYSFGGSGKFMEGFEYETLPLTEKYNGRINTKKISNNTEVYTFDNEFDKAAQGGPAVDKYGNAVGMCIGGIVDDISTDRCVLPAYVIADCLERAGVDYPEYSEIKYKIIIYLALGAGILILLTVFIFVISSVKEINKKSENENNSDKSDEDINGEWSYSIEILDGTLKGQIYKINSDIIIGRDPSKCGIVYPLKEPGISGEHCRIYTSGMVCCIKDENSAYGTFLGNGTRLNADKSYVLKNGDVFFLASVINSMRINIEKKGDI